MVEEDADSLKQQKMAVLKKQWEEQKNQQDQAAQAEMQLSALVQQYADSAGSARLANVKMVNKELYLKAAQTIMYLVQSGKISHKLQDKEIKRMLELASSQKRERKIEFVRK